MITFIILSIVWFVGFCVMYILTVIGEAVNHARDPIWWKLLISVLWPIVVPALTIFVMWNNYQYRRYIKKR